MATIDWRSSTASEGVISVEMISPNDLSVSYGPLSDVVLSDSSITASYETDTRTSATIAYIGSGWIRGTFLRIKYKIPSWGWSRTLGTYVATADTGRRNHGEWETKLTLQSAGLYTISTEYRENSWVLNTAAKVRTAMHEILNKSSRPYVDSATNDYAVTSPTILETGSSVLEWMFTLADMANVRLDVDGNGNVTIKNSPDLSSQTSIYRIDLADERGVAVDDVSRSTNYLSTAGKAVVSYKYTTTVNGSSVEKEIVGTATASGYSSPSARGYVITDFHNVSEMKEATVSYANNLAKQYLAESSAENIEWELNTTFLPIWEGDIVELYVRDGESRFRGLHRCLVKNLDINLATKQLSLTLKDV